METQVKKSPSTKADTKVTSASVQGNGIDFYTDVDFASPQRCENC
jgi:hypothetical protein